MWDSTAWTGAQGYVNLVHIFRLTVYAVIHVHWTCMRNRRRSWKRQSRCSNGTRVVVALLGPRKVRLLIFDKWYISKGSFSRLGDPLLTVPILGSNLRQGFSNSIVHDLFVTWQMCDNRKICHIIYRERWLRLWDLGIKTNGLKAKLKNTTKCKTTEKNCHIQRKKTFLNEKLGRLLRTNLITYSQP